jgi:hypothetical protein
MTNKIIDPIWETSDGREIPLSDMFSTHIHSAMAKLKDWCKDEEDPDRRRDLRKWHARFAKELKKRGGDWLERAQGPDRKAWEKRRRGEVPIEQMAVSQLWDLKRQLKGNPDPAARAQLRKVNKEIRRRKQGVL